MGEYSRTESIHPRRTLIIFTEPVYSIFELKSNGRKQQAMGKSPMNFCPDGPIQQEIRIGEDSAYQQKEPHTMAYLFLAEIFISFPHQPGEYKMTKGKSHATSK